MENIFLLKCKFCLTNPFIYDSFFTQLIDLASLPPLDLQNTLDKKEEDNNIQLGFTLLQLGSLAKDEQLRADNGYIKDNMRQCLRVVQDRYKPDTGRLIEQLIKGRDANSRSPSPMNTITSANTDQGRPSAGLQTMNQGPSRVAPLPGPIPIGRRANQQAADGVGRPQIGAPQLPNMNLSELNLNPSTQCNHHLTRQRHILKPS